uniref:Uncharacterized protein n=1 Tax=viral metagenome TaxID=1070528 RepID=A0A6C0LFA3_9ZZZZ
MEGFKRNNNNNISIYNKIVMNIILYKINIILNIDVADI